MSFGDHPDAKRVFDLDSISLLATIKKMRNKAQFLSGRKNYSSPKLFIGSTINPFVSTIESRILQLQK